MGLSQKDEAGTPDSDAAQTLSFFEKFKTYLPQLGAESKYMANGNLVLC